MDNQALLWLDRLHHMFLDKNLNFQCGIVIDELHHECKTPPFKLPYNCLECMQIDLAEILRSPVFQGNIHSKCHVMVLSSSFSMHCSWDCQLLKEVMFVLAHEQHEHTKMAAIMTVCPGADMKCFGKNAWQVNAFFKHTVRVQGAKENHHELLGEENAEEKCWKPSFVIFYFLARFNDASGSFSLCYGQLHVKRFKCLNSG